MVISAASDKLTQQAESFGVWSQWHYSGSLRREDKGTGSVLSSVMGPLLRDASWGEESSQEIKDKTSFPFLSVTSVPHIQAQRSVVIQNRCMIKLMFELVLQGLFYKISVLSMKGPKLLKAGLEFSLKSILVCELITVFPSPPLLVTLLL